MTAQCISVGRRAGTLQVQRADDTPIALYVGGRTGALIKEQVCRWTVKWMAGEAAEYLRASQERGDVFVAGKVEQWIDREKRILGPGDSAFIPGGIVHASFNVGDGNASIVAILGPCVGAIGYELVDVAGEAPWNTLRR